MKCRHCQQVADLPLIDLGASPPSNAYLTPVTMRRPEKWFPLKVVVCQHCWLVQAEAYSRAAELFDEEYAYFSSFSDQWLRHARTYVDRMSEELSLGRDSMVVEVASNDGYLLQFVQQKNIPCLGVEPTASTAAASRARGIHTHEEFFGVPLAQRLKQQGFSADLMAANNVLAHVPDINDFVKGFETLLKPSGVATFEFPHLLNLIEQGQFDTIYHEHFSYLSFSTVREIFAQNGLNVFDVEEYPTHGGSLRVYAQRSTTGTRDISESVGRLIAKERTSGVQTAGFYSDFQARAEIIKNDLVLFLLNAKAAGKKVAGYGAAAKGNTLLNFAGIRSDILTFVVDKNPNKQGKFLPGSRIPVLSPEALDTLHLDYLLILPWNLQKEIIEQNISLRNRGTKFVTAVPKLTVL